MTLFSLPLIFASYCFHVKPTDIDFWNDFWNDWLSISNWDSQYEKYLLQCSCWTQHIKCLSSAVHTEGTTLFWHQSVDCTVLGLLDLVAQSKNRNCYQTVFENPFLMISNLNFATIVSVHFPYCQIYLFQETLHTVDAFSTFLRWLVFDDDPRSRCVPLESHVTSTVPNFRKGCSFSTKKKKKKSYR